jgi:hypothetical protein
VPSEEDERTRERKRNTQSSNQMWMLIEMNMPSSTREEVA